MRLECQIKEESTFSFDKRTGVIAGYVRSDGITYAIVNFANYLEEIPITDLEIVDSDELI